MVLWVSPSTCRLDYPCVSDKSSIWAVNSPWVKRISSHGAELSNSLPGPYYVLQSYQGSRILFCSGLGEFEIWLKYTGAIYVQCEGQEEEKQEVNLE